MIELIVNKTISDLVNPDVHETSVTRPPLYIIGLPHLTLITQNAYSSDLVDVIIQAQGKTHIFTHPIGEILSFAHPQAGLYYLVQIGNPPE